MQEFHVQKYHIVRNIGKILWLAKLTVCRQILFLQHLILVYRTSYVTNIKSANI